VRTPRWTPVPASPQSVTPSLAPPTSPDIDLLSSFHISRRQLIWTVFHKHPLLLPFPLKSPPPRPFRLPFPSLYPYFPNDQPGPLRPAFPPGRPCVSVPPPTEVVQLHPKRPVPFGDWNSKHRMSPPLPFSWSNSFNPSLLLHVFMS